jgi:hypothetical protein
MNIESTKFKNKNTENRKQRHMKETINEGNILWQVTHLSLL